MADKIKIAAVQKQVCVLVVDDSLEFRRLLRDIFGKTNRIKIVGEAVNGVEALDMALKLNPDVIVMDMEMPLLDGMASLQQLLIFKPTPTIMVSSLTREGGARGFDAIKNGAVDFIYKDSFFHGKVAVVENEIISRVLYASNVVVQSVKPLFVTKNDIPSTPVKPNDIIFCEECGTRNIFDAEQKKVLKELKCNQCGDLLEENLINKYKRINYVSVIGAGMGAYANLLRIIPEIPEEFSGAIVIVVHAESCHVDAFAGYLDAASNIKVRRMVDGLNIEGGNCYIASAHDNIYIKPYSTQYTIRRAKAVPGYGPVDIIMNSVTSVFKERVSGIILSGEELDGEKGIHVIKKNNGMSAVLDASKCLCKGMGENITRKCMVDKIVDEQGIIELIVGLHKASNAELSNY